MGQKVNPKVLRLSTTEGWTSRWFDDKKYKETLLEDFKIRKALMEKIKHAGMLVLQNGTIPGIPGELLNQGMLYGQDVIVILVDVDESGPDFTSSVDLCMAVSKILPGVSCDLNMMRKQAEIAEKQIKQTEKETRAIRDSMYG